MSCKLCGKVHGCDNPSCDNADISRRIEQLELENAELKAKIKQIHKDLGCELSDPNGTIWEHAAKVQAENTELKAKLEECERQIREGELVPLVEVHCWLSEHCVTMSLAGHKSLKQFAAERVKEGVE